MPRMPRLAVLSLLTAVLAGCATTGGRPVDLKQSRRVVGTEADVRVDAEVFGDELTSSISIPFNYDVTNQRSASIAIAEIVPDASYDPDTRIVTISIGSEVPGQNLLPRLVSIAPGEKKSFSSVVHFNIMAARAMMTPRSLVPNALQVKVNFLTDTTPFKQLFSIPERAVNDPQLAADLFPKWLERNEVVITNTLPMKWSAQAPNPNDPSNPAEAGKKRGRRG
jgi:hypothetical protein